MGLVCAALAIAAPLSCSVDYEANQAEYDRKRCEQQPLTCGGEGGIISSGGAGATGGKGGTAGTTSGGNGGIAAGGDATGGMGDGGAIAEAGAGGLPATCVEPDVRCSADGDVETCSGTAWVLDIDCTGTTPECEAGSCVECVSDSVRCDNGVPQLCVSNAWEDQTACTGSQICQSGECVTPPSCTGLAADCGSGGDDSCCASLIVPGTAPGAPFYRNNSGTNPATVTSFMLDKYEVTVGRFRKFLADYENNLPAAGDGAHPNIADSGWNAAWDTSLQLTPELLESDLACNSYATWTASAGANENKPINCLDWFHAFAFCAWDGGYLPTDLEWNYAAAGGDDQRQYPWGNTAPTADESYAIWDCHYGGNGGNCPQVDAHIAPVGSATLGVGKWGHLDLAGNMEEWNLDYYGAYPDQCDDCADLTDSLSRVKRGGYFSVNTTTSLLTSSRATGTASTGGSTEGVRCARPL